MISCIEKWKLPPVRVEVNPHRRQARNIFWTSPKHFRHSQARPPTAKRLPKRTTMRGWVEVAPFAASIFHGRFGL
jgi:hypothetical protein